MSWDDKKKEQEKAKKLAEDLKKFQAGKADAKSLNKKYEKW